MTRQTAPESISPCLVQIDTEASAIAFQENPATESPINQLPVELLSTIFLTCLPPASHPWYNKKIGFDGQICKDLKAELYPPMIPMLLCRVCTLWRSVALNTAGLWANIVVHDSYETFMDPKMVLQWVGRTQGYPLSLSSFLTLISPESRVLELLRRCVGRWARFHFILDGVRAIPLSIGMGPTPGPVTPGCFESLKSVELELRCGDEDYFDEGLTYIIDKSPNLRLFIISTGLLDTELDPHKFTHATLTHLMIDPTMEAEMAIHILHGCPSLVSVSLILREESSLKGDDMDDYLRRIEEIQEGRPSIVVAQSLENLKLRVTSESAFIHLCHSISTPQLANLHILGTSRFVGLEEFQTFLSRSACRLRAFNLQILEVTETHPVLMVGFLCHASVADSLEELSLENVDDRIPQCSSMFIDFLSPQMSGMFLPSLRKLCLSTTLGTDDGLVKVADMLRSRFQMRPNQRSWAGYPAHTLESAKLHLQIFEEYWVEDNGELQALRDEGYNVDFSFEWRGIVLSAVPWLWETQEQSS